MAAGPPLIPLLLAIGCLVLAFTGTRISFQETSPTIVLVMDVSDSMDATDVAPNRMAAAEAAAITFLDELPPDFRVGLATFAGEANVRCPHAGTGRDRGRARGDRDAAP